MIAERAMYFATQPGRLWAGGHVNTGIVAPSTSWFHAEGATGTFFNTFILLSNPQDDGGEGRGALPARQRATVITRPKTLAPKQRLTINPATEGDRAWRTPRCRPSWSRTCRSCRSDRCTGKATREAARRRPQQQRRRGHRRRAGASPKAASAARATSTPTSCSRIRRPRRRECASHICARAARRS